MLYEILGMGKTITKTTISALILAVTLTTGLVAISLPTIEAQQPSADCPPNLGKFVNVVVNGVEMGPYDIKGYTYSSTSKTFMFTHEPDDDNDGMGLSEKVLAAIKNGDKVDVHFSTCKTTDPGFKKHVVWLTAGKLTDVSETVGVDDDFPTEKVSGEFSEIMRKTTSGSGAPPL